MKFLKCNEGVENFLPYQLAEIIRETPANVKQWEKFIQRIETYNAWLDASED